jgi:chromate transporter
MADRRAQPSLAELFLLFSRVGLTSFGGGTSMWLFRQIVQTKQWIGEDEFLDVMALCQALPGINVTNIAVWVGRRLMGWRGAAAAVAGIIVLPSITIVLIAVLFTFIAHFRLTEVILTGATAAAVGLPFSMGIMMARRLRRALIPLSVMTVTFIAVGIAKLPLIWVVLACGSFSIVLEAWRQHE